MRVMREWMIDARLMSTDAVPLRPPPLSVLCSLLQVSKSANYCCTSSGNDVGFLLLCEVALGEMHLLTEAKYMDKPPGKTMSTKGVGVTVPDPQGDKRLANGSVRDDSVGVQCAAQ
jgi:hypothetical protein